MSLELDVALARGARRVEARFRVAAGETVALVGPNGAGKSTVLGVIAGLLAAERGRVVLDGRELDGGEGGVFVPPEQRRVGVVFQDLRLFPHMSALDNVAFGLRCSGARRASAREAARRWLGRVGVDGAHQGLRPGALSGGQQQRVALARALAMDPAALLLDEPMAAVDASARIELRRALRAHLAGFPGPRVLVAHRIADALALADRVVVLEGGRVVQQGTPRELVSAPRSVYVADLVGQNGYVGVARGGAVEVGGTQIAAASVPDGEVFATFHPRAVSLHGARPAGSPRNVWAVTVRGLEPALERVRVELEGPLGLVAEVTPAAVRELGLAPGVAVWAAVKATEVTVAPR